jgi:N-methylhydantoinase A
VPAEVSIARVDALKRVMVGPDSAGAAPGPACYGRGGNAATVTDADLVLGRIDPNAFAGGRLQLNPDAAATAIAHSIGKPLDLSAPLAAAAMTEIVDENMASAARVHAVERGKSLEERTLIAFGGAAPLHASRVAGKLGINRIVVPTGAGVGSAVGMLTAGVAYEVARSLYQRVRDLDPTTVNAHIEAMRLEAGRVVEKSAAGKPLVVTRTGYMRYVGQGHEIAVPLPARAFDVSDRVHLHAAFEQEYRRQFGRVIPGLEAEVLSWALELRTLEEPPQRVPASAISRPQRSQARRKLFDPQSGKFLEADVFVRSELAPGGAVEGPALIVEDETTTVVAAGWRAAINAIGYVILERNA